MWILRTLMLLALIVWIGGIIFFALVVAPILFTVLPTPQMAGSVVGPALTRLHDIGLVAGVVFLICSVIYNWRRYSQLRLLSATHILMVLMLVMTAVSQFVVTPRIRHLRSEPLIAERVPDVAAEFNRLHRWSTRLEGGVLFLGLGVVGLAARRFGDSRL
jgi:uncharacterized membrane protein